MKNLLYYFSLMFGICFLLSCVPNQDGNGDFLIGVDYDPNTGNGGDPGTAPSKLLKTVTIDDGDVLIYNYSYNANKKLTGINTNDNSVKINITYQSSGNIAKITRTENGLDGVTGEEITPTYSGTQITKLDITHTEGTGSIKSVANLTYGSNGWPSIVKENYYAEGSTTQTVATIVSDFTYAGNNITKWHFNSSLNASLPVPVFDFLQEIDLTVNLQDYDNKINPYNLLPKDFLIAVVHAEADASSITGFANNNAKTINFILKLGGTPIEDTQSATYIYDKDGYPVSTASSDIVTKFEYQ